MSERYWVGKVAAQDAVQGDFTVIEEHKGEYLVGWHYRAAFDDLPAVREAFADGVDEAGNAPYVHRVIAWSEVGEEEGTASCTSRPAAARTTSSWAKAGAAGHRAAGRGRPLPRWLRACSAARTRPASPPRSIEELEARDFYYHLEPYTHRYPHCWRCGTALLFRVVDEWYISMGQVYDMPRDQLTAEQKAASLRYQIMDVVDQIELVSRASATTARSTGSSRCPTG